MNKSPQVYKHLVSLRLSDEQVARLDARTREGASRAEVIREAIDGVSRHHDVIHDGDHVSHDEPDDVIHDGPDVPPMPEPWAPATINTDVLRRLQWSAPGLDAALAVVLAAAESGDLDRVDVARIVATRWSLKDGDRLHYDNGQLYLEQAPKRQRRTVEQRG